MEIMLILIIYCVVSVYVACLAAFKYNPMSNMFEKIAIWLVFVLFWMPILICSDIDSSLRKFFEDRL